MEGKKGAVGHALIGGCWNTEAGGRQAGGKVSEVNVLWKDIWLIPMSVSLFSMSVSPLLL